MIKPDLALRHAVLAAQFVVAEYPAGCAVEQRSVEDCRGDGLVVSSIGDRIPQLQPAKRVPESVKVRKDRSRPVGRFVGDPAHVVNEVVRLVVDSPKIAVLLGLVVLRADGAVPPVEGLGARSVEDTGYCIANGRPDRPAALSRAGDIADRCHRRGRIRPCPNDLHPAARPAAAIAHQALERPGDQVGNVRVADVERNAHV